MITEFTCGICRAVWPSSNMEWLLKVHNVPFGFIQANGEAIHFTTQHSINFATLIEINVLMYDIKRQYNQF
jgi:hypothetical protein